MNLNDTTASRVKAKREEANLKQEELAKMLGISTSAYSRLETGESEISLNKLEKIANALNLKPSDFIGTNHSQVNKLSKCVFTQTGISCTFTIHVTPEHLQEIRDLLK